MTSTAQKLLAEAQSLTPTERLELAAELIASAEGEADSGYEEAWAEELKRRLTSLEDGTAELLDWSVVSARIEDELDRK